LMQFPNNIYGGVLWEGLCRGSYLYIYLYIYRLFIEVVLYRIILICRALYTGTHSYINT
jgi:hypothetical protein